MKKKLIIFLSLIFVVIFVCFFLSYNRNLNFEFVEEKSLKINSERKWLTILDGSFSDEFLEEEVENLVKSKIDIENMNFNKYNYIVTINHKLKNIKYNYFKCNQRNKFLIPTSIIGEATLEKQSANKIYIYRFRKINISPDWHNLDNLNYE